MAKSMLKLRKTTKLHCSRLRSFRGMLKNNGCGFCRQIHLTRHFSHALFTIHFMHITLHGSSVCLRASLHPHATHDELLIVRSLPVSSCLSFSCFSLLFTTSVPYSTCTLTCTPSSMWTAPREKPAAPSPNEEYCPPGDMPSSHKL